MKKRIHAAVIFLTTLTAISVTLAAFIYNGYFHINGRTAKKYSIRGVDVSHYQGDIDWQILSGEDIHFAYIKATEGSSHTDEKFAYNYAESQKTELKIGAYHFFSFDSPGISQAEHFIRTVNPFKGMLPPAVDVEFYGDKKKNPPKTENVETELRAYLNQVEQAFGTKPVIYATMEAWELYIRGRFDEYPLWIRNILSEPILQPATEGGQEKNWTFWQYTDRGRLNGYSGEETFIDLNVFCGSEEEWQQGFFIQMRKGEQNGNT